MLCPLYSDIRYELFQKALKFINNFNMMNVENKFIELMNCDKIQTVLVHTLEFALQNLQSLPFRGICDLEYLSVSIANGSAPLRNNAIVRLVVRGS
jgi:hypothetical protein